MQLPTRNGYWVEQGQLLAGEYPRSIDDGPSRKKLRWFLQLGIRTFIDLTEPGEWTYQGPLKPYDQLVKTLAAGMGVPCTVERYAIPDMSLPHPDTMRRILDSIDAAIAARSPVYVHCWGGFGRTGTVVGCWLQRHGKATPDTVFETIAKLRARTAFADYSSPQTPAQRAFVRDWRER